MKALNILLIAALMMSAAYAQRPLKVVKQKVGNPDILQYWKVGETKTVNDVQIVRLEGEDGYEYITNAFYTSRSAIIKTLDEKAVAENLTASQKSEMVGPYEAASPGGQIALFFSRPSQRLADPTFFTVTVTDATTNEIVCSKTLDKQDPYYYKWGIWYYYKTINVPEAVGETFIIQVRDEGTKTNFTFRVSGNLADQMEEKELLTVN